MRTAGIVLAVVSGVVALAMFAAGETAIALCCLTPCSAIGAQMAMESDDEEDD